MRAQLIKQKVTKEGEYLPFFQTELKVSNKVSVMQIVSTYVCVMCCNFLKRNYNGLLTMLLHNENQLKAKYNS